MKKSIAIIAGCLALATIGATTAKAQMMTETYPSYIEANGNAEKSVLPDLFYLRVDINEIDSKGKKSVELQQNDLVSALKKCGINTAESLTRLSLSSSYYTKKTNMASASYQIKLHSADEVAAVWQRLDALGFSKISFTKAEYSKMDELKDEVRKDAIRNAKAQAASMAEAIGQSIGKCFYISAGYTNSPVLYAQPRMLAKSMAVNSTEDAMSIEDESIEFNTIKVTANVTAKFVLN